MDGGNADIALGQEPVSRIMQEQLSRSNISALPTSPRGFAVAVS